jgi:hypothetical protein
LSHFTSGHPLLRFPSGDQAISRLDLLNIGIIHNSVLLLLLLLLLLLTIHNDTDQSVNDVQQRNCRLMYNHTRCEDTPCRQIQNFLAGCRRNRIYVLPRCTEP